MGKRTLIYRTCAKHAGTNSWEVWWDHDARTRVKIDVPSGNSCHFYNLPPGTLLDSWCGGPDGNSSTMVKIFSVWDGTGRPPMGYTYGENEGQFKDEVVRVETTPNHSACGATVCGLKIEDVQRVYDSPGSITITIITSGYQGEVEYSLNNFAEVQSSNVFPGLSPGSYKAYARIK